MVVGILAPLALECGASDTSSSASFVLDSPCHTGFPFHRFAPFINQIVLLPCREPDALSLAHNFALHALLDLHTSLLLLFNSGFVLVMFSEEVIKSTYRDLKSVCSMKCSFTKIGICLREAVIVDYDSNTIPCGFTICIRWYDW